VEPYGEQKVGISEEEPFSVAGVKGSSRKQSGGSCGEKPLSAPKDTTKKKIVGERWEKRYGAGEGTTVSAAWKPRTKSRIREVSQKGLRGKKETRRGKMSLGALGRIKIRLGPRRRHSQQRGLTRGAGRDSKKEEVGPQVVVNALKRKRPEARGGRRKRKRN